MDNLKQIIEDINKSLIEPINPKNKRIEDEEHYYKVIKISVCDALEELKRLKEREYIKYISNEDILKLRISYKNINNIIENNIKNKNNYKLPAKTSIKIDNEGFYNTMPCIVKDNYSCKIVVRNVNNKPCISGDILLYNINTSKLLSVLDCRWITSVRTGSVALISMKYLAKKNFKDISLIGLGSCMYAFMRCFLCEYDCKDYNIHLYKYKNHCEKFIEEFKDYEINWIIHDNIDIFLETGDVIISAVTFKNELYTNNINLFKKGVLIIPIQTRGFQNCDKIFERIVVDDDKHVKGFTNYSEFKNYCELTDIINGDNSGRVSDDERIIAYNIGIGIHDNILASFIYDKIQNK